MRNKAFFFADFEMLDQTRGQPAITSIPSLAQRDGILTVDVRHPLTGAFYPAGTPVPMTAFARKVLSELPAPTGPGSSNNLAINQSFTNTTPKVGGKVDVQFTPRLSAFGRFGWRDADLFDSPNIPGPSGGGGNAETYANNRQFSGGLTYQPVGRQAVYLDDANTPADLPDAAELISYKTQGISIVGSPMFSLLALDASQNIVPSAYARHARSAGLDIIAWTLERSDILADGHSGFYYQTVDAAIRREGDVYAVLDVMAKDVGVLGVFTDWPATVTYYANCMRKGERLTP